MARLFGLMATTVDAGFAELLSRLNLTATQKLTAKAHIESIVSFLDSKFALAPAGAFYTGSYRRGTMIRWTRDVDILCALSVPRYWGVYKSDSSSCLYMVRNALNERFGSTKVSTKRVAVKVDYSDITADVVPCFPRTGGGFLMPSGTGGWLATNPPFHTTLMKEADEAHSMRLKPIARLMKAWNFQNGHHLSSIHVELIVERMWRGVAIGTVTSATVAESIRVMPSWLQSSFADPSPDGRPIDAELARDDREVAIRLLIEDAGRSTEAEVDRKAGRIASAFERWGVVYRGAFPAFG